MSWVLIAIAVVAAVVLWQRHRARRSDVFWRPLELRGAQTVFAERMFETLTAPPLVAKVDRGFRASGAIVLVELKTRRRPQAYRSDVIELSAQKLAVEEEAGETVKPFAYVVTQHPSTGERRHHRVRLLDAHELAQIARRREGS